MHVRVRLFAAYREAAGTKDLVLDLPERSTVRDALRQLHERFPRTRGLPDVALASVNLEYVGPDYVLHEGDELAFIPPVSGGDQDRPIADGATTAMFKITTEPLSSDALATLVRTDECGAVATFLGVVRNHSRGRRVLYLEYEAYPELAEKKMAEIADEIRVKWGVERVAIFHRVGRLEIGEASVAIAVAAPHRREALAACQYAIDRLKQIVPIWKKEVWEGGETWVGWEGQPPAEAVSLGAPSES
ncbi:MAG TPA: molybdenum cofactor biosynthesis protein MoaE [Chloroflexota bacterium]